MSTCSAIPTDEALSPAAERIVDELLPSPEVMVMAAAERLLYLQDRHASGWPEPAITYEQGDGPLLSKTTASTVKITGDQGSGPTPTVPPAVMEALAYHGLLGVFTRAKEQTGALLPAPLLAGGVWWSVRMEQRPLAALAAEVGQPPKYLRRAMLTYEAEVLAGLVQLA